MSRLRQLLGRAPGTGGDNITLRSIFLLQPLKVSDSERFLVTKTVRPSFTWATRRGISPIGSTATGSSAISTTAKRFTVALVMGLADVGKLERPNAEGQLPFSERIPPNPTMRSSIMSGLSWMRPNRWDSCRASAMLG